VDDQSWKTTFELVTFMNIEHQRGRFLQNGVFASKAIWMNFLVAIWYTLREDPAFICT
jgi:hypothetical protein